MTDRAPLGGGGTADERPPHDAAAHVLVADVTRPELTDDANHHLARVLRLRAGAVLTVTDGAGSWRLARMGVDDIEVDGEIVQPTRPEPAITIAFALTKGDKPETVVQKLTEMGVDRIVPFQAGRSVVRWGEEKIAAQQARWVAIAAGALQQSRGCWMPTIDPVGSLDDVVALGAARLDRVGAPPSLARSVVAVGPEGGWDDHERQRLETPVSLGPNVLRAETAAVTAGGVLCALRSGLVRESANSFTERGN